MDDNSQHVLIVGAGQAGARAAEALRKVGFRGRVTMVGDEIHAPYERPPLSKTILTGAKLPSSSAIFEERYLQDRSIELITGVSVSSIDAEAKRATLDDGRQLSWTRLLLCTGGRARQIPLAPIGSPQVFYLRTLQDASALAQTFRRIESVAIVGAGFLGLEIAASAQGLGIQATVIESRPNILPRAVVPEIAAHIEAAHRERGVRLRLASQLVGVERRDGKVILSLSDGEPLKVDAMVVATGLVPNTELAEALGLDVEDGIVVDEFGQTSRQDIFAAGDVANRFNAFLGRRARIESWQNAQNHATATAKAIAGSPEPYQEVPWFWSDQYDLNIQILGQPLPSDRLMVRGRPADRRFICFNLRDERLVGATLFNMGAETRFVRRLMESRSRVDDAALRDVSIRLRDLAELQRS